MLHNTKIYEDILFENILRKSNNYIILFQSYAIKIATQYHPSHTKTLDSKVTKMYFVTQSYRKHT